MLFKRIVQASLNENILTRDATIYLFKGFRICGLHPTTKHVTMYHLWSIALITFSTVYVPLSYAHTYFDDKTNLTPVELMTSLQVHLNTWGFAIKFIILYILKERLIVANAYLDKLDARCKSTMEAQKIRQVVALCNRIVFSFCIIYGTYTVSNYISSLLFGRLPFNIYNPFFDWQQNPTNFYVQATFELFGVGMVVFMEQLTDCYPIIYVEAIRLHVNLLLARVRKLKHEEHNGSDSDCSGSNEHTIEHLIDCIIDHKNMLLYCDAIRPVISGTIFVQFLVCGSIIGIAMINLMFFANYLVAISTIIYLFAVLLQTFPLCYFCNLLIADCDELSNAVFHINWYIKNRQYRQTLLYFLQKVQKPMTFSAMKVFTITLFTNIQFAKIAMSIYTLAQGMNLEGKFTKQQ